MLEENCTLQKIKRSLILVFLMTRNSANIYLFYRAFHKVFAETHANGST